MKVRAVRVPCRLVQVVVLGYELLELRLDVGELRGRELEFRDRHARLKGGGICARKRAPVELGAFTRLLEVLQETQLLRKEEEQRPAAPTRARRAAHAVNIRLRLVGGVILPRSSQAARERADGIYMNLHGADDIGRNVRGPMTSAWS